MIKRSQPQNHIGPDSLAKLILLCCRLLPRQTCVAYLRSNLPKARGATLLLLSDRLPGKVANSKIDELHALDLFLPKSCLRRIWMWSETDVAKYALGPALTNDQDTLAHAIGQ
jgi:hypothetical protein